MSVKMGIAARVALVTALALADAGMTRAQESTAPLFSTPASRSTTGAPILNDPSKQNGELIDNTGGGRKAPSVSPCQFEQRLGSMYCVTHQQNAVACMQAQREAGTLDMSLAQAIQNIEPANSPFMAAAVKKIIGDLTS